MNRHVAAASIAFTGIIAELLIIALAGLPYRPGQLRSEFLFSGITAVVILMLMIVQLIFNNFWRRSMPHLPRRPDNIAAVMTYVADTSIVKDFQGLESSSVRQRNRTIRDMKKTYAYGWRKEDESGRIRWVVDEVVSAERKSLIDRPSAGEAAESPAETSVGTLAETPAETPAETRAEIRAWTLRCASEEHKRDIRIVNAME